MTRLPAQAIRSVQLIHTTDIDAARPLEDAFPPRRPHHVAMDHHLHAHPAERQATYDRRIKAGGSDAQTLVEIGRLKKELTDIETEIAGLDLE